MEISKTTKVDLSTINIKNQKNAPLTIRITNLEPGEAFVIEGVERSSIEGCMIGLKKDGRKFTIRKVGAFRYQVIRLA